MRVYCWLNPKLEQRPSKLEGCGIFVKEKVAKGEKLAILGGKILTLDEEQNLPEGVRDTGVQIDDNFVLTSAEQNEDTDCFNHSCEPNAGFSGQIFIVAMRDLEINEEVTFDYAMALSGEEDYELQCLCGKNSCRKIITQNDWKKDYLQEKYKDYFQHYLKLKIEKK